MEWKIIHYYQDGNEPEKEDVHSEYKTYEEAKKVMDNLNECTFSNEVYYIEKI